MRPLNKNSVDIKKSALRNQAGYTLLEVLIALIIFMAAVVPLIGRLWTVNMSIDAQNKYTAQCLLEQEIACSQTFPADIIPLKRRMVNAKEWEITSALTGSTLQSCAIAVSVNKKTYASAVIYVYDNQTE